MCGIYGYIHLSKKNPDLKELHFLTRFMTLENQSRGKDSTGIAVIDKDNNIFNVRKVKSASGFLSNSAVDDALRINISKDARKILGHTRYATTGDVNLNNTQPFMYQNIIGTHNGIVTNYKSLFKRFQLKASTTCDSEALFAMMSVCDTPRKMAKKLGKVNGYFALSFHNMNDPNKHYFALGNHECHFMTDQKENFIIYSSDKSVLKELSLVFNLKLEAIEIKEDTLVELDIKNKKLTAYKINIGAYSKWQNWGGTDNYYGFRPHRETYIKDYDAKKLEENIPCDCCGAEKAETKMDEYTGHNLCDKCITEYEKLDN